MGELMLSFENVVVKGLNFIRHQNYIKKHYFE